MPGWATKAPSDDGGAAAKGEVYPVFGVPLNLAMKYQGRGYIPEVFFFFFFLSIYLLILILLLSL